MRSRTRGRAVSALGWIGFLGSTLLVYPLPLSASANISNRIICRPQLSLTRRGELASKLRAITGWPDLKFDPNGALELSSNPTSGGSQTARALINQAQSGGKLIILEDASGRQDVVFCRVVPGRWKHHSSEMPPAFVVLIDFTDFDQLMGDEAALKAFDAGWAVLHEIDHVVNDSEDAGSANESGECEDHINRMRRECNLPIRREYFFTYFPHAQASDFRARFVRLAFDQDDQVTTRRRRFWLMWDATLVGGLDAQQVAKQK